VDECVRGWWCGAPRAEPVSVLGRYTDAFYPCLWPHHLSAMLAKDIILEGVGATKPPLCTACHCR